MDNTPTESLIDVLNPPRDSLTVVDNRTGQQYCIPIRNNAVMAVDVKKIKQGSEDPGLLVYDPGYMNTACCTSSICEIDGDKGMLTYRGYDIEELVEKSSFLEVAFLLIYGRMPERETLEAWETKVMRHTFIHENLVQLMKNFRYDAHPMGMLISSVSAMATFYPEANPALQGPNIYKDAQMRNKQIFRILGKIPTIAACAYRHRIGRPYNNPVNDLSYAENFLYMLDRLSETDYRPHPVLVKSLEKMWILHAEHELNCSTATMRQLSSTLVDPYTAVAGAAAALYGPLHGGANEAVLRMLEQIGDVQNIPAFIAEVKAKKRKLFGFGHRVYKNYDPRATIMKQIARDIFELLGTSPLWEIALVLEQTALNDEYFVTRKLYPNVDFYSGIIYNAMGFPTDMFPVLFTIPRVVGWLAHWVEGLQEETRIFRPRQIYLGDRALPFMDVNQRQPFIKQDELRSSASAMARRRQVSSDDRRALVSSQSSVPAVIESQPSSDTSQHSPSNSDALSDNKRSSSYYLPKTIKFGVGNSDK